MHESQSINSIYTRAFAIAALITAAFALLLPFSVLSATISNLDGCINTDRFEEGFEYVRITAPECEFTIQLDESEDAPVVSIQNSNPYLYSVTDSDGAEQIIFIEDGDVLQFVPVLEAGESETYTVAPWTNDHTLEDGESTDFTFAALGDTQTKPGGSDPNSVFVKIAAHLGMQSMPFATISGDLIGGHANSEDEHEAQYDRYDTVIDSLTTPTFTVPGDHDTRQSLDEYYSPRYGERFYRFEYQDVSIVGINSVEDLDAEGEFTETDLTTVESLLDEAQDSTQTIVFFHHPIIPPDWASSEGVDESQRLTLAQLFVDYGVDVVLVGDAHGYDDNLIDSDDLEGLTGSFRQLTIGGAGGYMYNYEGRHFYMLIRVTESGIEYERIEYDHLDTEYAVDGNNDGSESSIEVTITNNSEYDVPRGRIPFHLNTANPYAVDQDMTFYEVVTHTEADETTRGYVDLEYPALTETVLTVGAQTFVRTGIDQTVQPNGEIAYTNLPSAGNSATTLSFSSASNPLTVQAITWNTETEEYEWTTTIPSGADYNTVTAEYSITDFTPNSWVEVWQNGTLHKRVLTDTDGAAEFSVEESGESEYAAVIGELEPTAVGALPVSTGGAQFRATVSGDSDIHAFFVYNENKEKSAQSLWADLDGDDELEVVTFAGPGESVPLRAFEVDGTQIDSLYPFASDYSKGYSAAVGDVDADGDDEIAIARLGNKKSLVRIYDLQDGELMKIDQFRAFSTNYKGGTSVAMADINGDGDAEIITGTREEKTTLRIYKWVHTKGEAKKWLQRKPFTGDNATKGIVLETADMNNDGREDIIVGSAEGNGMLKLYGYGKNAKLKKIGQRHTFSKSLEGGVRLATGVVTGDAKQQLLVTPAGQRKYTGQVRMFQLNIKRKTLKSIARRAPFGKQLEGGIDISTADINGDGIEEVAVSRLQNSGLIDILEYSSGKLVETESLRPYSSSFTGGLYLTKD